MRQSSSTYYPNRSQLTMGETQQPKLIVLMHFSGPTPLVPVIVRTDISIAHNGAIKISCSHKKVKGNQAEQFGASAPVYLAAVIMGFMVAEVLAAYAAHYNKTRITPRYL